MKFDSEKKTKPKHLHRFEPASLIRKTWVVKRNGIVTAVFIKITNKHATFKYMSDIYYKHTVNECFSFLL